MFTKRLCRQHLTPIRTIMFKTSVVIKEPKIEAFVEPSELDLESLLRAFLDAGRLKRARSIKDNELRIEKETDKLVVATVRDYHIVIDFEARTILIICRPEHMLNLAKALREICESRSF